MPKPAARPRWGSDGNPLATRFTLALVLDRHPDVIARHCDPVACDVATRALLYDVERSAERLGQRARRGSDAEGRLRVSEP